MKKYTVQIKNPNNGVWHFLINQNSIGNSSIIAIPENKISISKGAELSRMNLYNSEKEAKLATGQWIHQKDIIRYDLQQSAPWIKTIEELTIRVVSVSFDCSDEFNFMEIADKNYSH